MPNSKIHIFNDFNSFHNMANGALQARHEDIQVFKFSEVGEGSVSETPLFKTNFYQIGFFKEVQFEVTHFGTTQDVNRKNAVVMFKPGQTCSFRKADPNANGFAIMFKESFIDWRLHNTNTLKDFSILNPAFECVLFLADEVFSDFIEIAAKMYFEYTNTLDINSLSILRLYCQLLIEKLNRVCSKHVLPATGTMAFKTTQDFKSLVYQNVNKTKTVADYAEMLFITEKTLINYTRKVSELTPKEFINTVIIEESKAMLLNKFTVDEVASYFNFTDQAHFSNFFKKKTGQTPNLFKKDAKR
ncbi:MAG: helix-turn-helix domain-containing protein [Bacteroidota bacterium]